MHGRDSANLIARYATINGAGPADGLRSLLHGGCIHRFLASATPDCRSPIEQAPWPEAGPVAGPQPPGSGRVGSGVRWARVAAVPERPEGEDFGKQWIAPLGTAPGPERERTRAGQTLRMRDRGAHGPADSHASERWLNRIFYTLSYAFTKQCNTLPRRPDAGRPHPRGAGQPERVAPGDRRSATPGPARRRGRPPQNLHAQAAARPGPPQQREPPAR